MSDRPRTRVVYVPQVDTKGVTSERTPKMLQMLSSRFEVSGVPVGRLNAFVYDQGKSQLARYLLFPLDLALNSLRTLQALRQGGDVVFAEGSYFSFAAGIAARLRDRPLVWDNHGHIVTFSKVQGKSALFTRGNVLFERFLERLCSKMLVVNARDRDDYQAMGFDPGKLEVVPTCADMRLVEAGMAPREEARARLGIPGEAMLVLFVGRLGYGPNAEAAAYLAGICPRVRERVPGCRFYVAGSGSLPVPPPEGMELLGFVPDLHAWLSAADVCVAPMWKGLGILTKVLDYMSAGRAAVVSPLALEGIPELEHGANCLVGRDPGDFEGQLIRVLEDGQLRDELARSGRELISARYSCEVVLAALVRIVEDLASRPTTSFFKYQEPNNRP